MTSDNTTNLTDWAGALLAVDPGLGGLVLTARASPLREAWIAAFLSLTDRPSRRIGPSAGDDRLFGGIDLTATLSAGRPIEDPGLIHQIGNGTLVLPMAERLSPGRAARLSQALDTGARFTVLALDEATDPDEGRPPEALMDRLAFRTTLEITAQRDTPAPFAAFSRNHIAAARKTLAQLEPPQDLVESFALASAALGVASLRATIFALHAAKAAAALLGGAADWREAAEIAAALTLAPRATRLPPEQAEDQAPPPDAPPPPGDSADNEADQDQTPQEIPPELLLEAARAALPDNILAQLAAQGSLARTRAGATAGAGDDQKGAARGRPAGNRPGDPRTGARLDLVATLRSAAPWQVLRRKLRPDADPDRLIITPDDFRLRRYKQKTEKVIIFLVDASGSAALARLAEVKGAIELMLAEAYVRREQVALITFRGTEADVLLPPTRSLVQAKRRLAGLPGGGGTPLASGLEAALHLADQIRRRGQSPHLAVLTDGRANVRRDGTAGRTEAVEEATVAARAIRAAGVPALLIDAGNRPAPAAKTLAQHMGATYLPLPRADAASMAGTLQSALAPRAA